MQESRWDRLQRLFGEALALDPAQREPFVARACAGESALADELRALLRSDAAGGDPVKAVVAQAAGRWLAGDRRALVGRQLGPWRVVAHIADGGMGAVYRAERADGQYEQQVAVKVLNPALVSAESRGRFQTERQILARLAHPLIARLLDGGSTEDGAPYLVMEFVDGEPIDAWCGRHAPDTAARLRLFVQVCRAVDFAHHNLVVHRDLKPGNILVDAHGAPRLLDFGIARLVDAEAATRTGDTVLTPTHASPEQITGGAITTATDIYALGVLLYDLLTGRLPHAPTTGSAVAMARAIVETQPPRPSSAVTLGSSRRLQEAQRRGERLTPERLARELQGDLDNIVLMALRKEPQRRYATARDLADDIERFLAHRPVSARPDTLAYRGAKLLRRHPVAVLASAAALVLSLAGAAAFTWRLAEERDRALAAERSARRTAEFTSSLLRGTGANEEASRRISVRELLDKAAQRVAEELKEDPEVASRMRSALGSAYHSWGAYTEAQRELESALADLRAQHPGPHADVAEVLSLLGTVAHDRGELEAGLEWARQAETMWRAVGDPAQHAIALTDVALSLNGLRRRAEAEPVFREALARQRQAYGGDHKEIAWTLNNLAWGLHAMGRLDEAAGYYEEALAMLRRLGAPNVELFQTLNNLAGLYGDRGDVETAERMLREVLALVEGLYGPSGHAAVARAHSALGVLEIERGRFEEAARNTRTALEANRKLLGERHTWTAITMQTHAIALLGLGRLDEAEALLQRSLAVRREVLPPGHADTISSHFGLARVAVAHGELALAERELRTAMDVIAKIAAPDRLQRDAVELLLGRVVALQGRREEGRAIAVAGVKRRQQTMPAGHHRRLAAEAGIDLPPFVERATEAAERAARDTLGVLRRRLGPNAPAVRELESQLALQPSS
jgi:serine/threonine-protein kinase